MSTAHAQQHRTQGTSDPGQLLRRAIPQPLIGIGTAVTACVTVAGLVVWQRPVMTESARWQAVCLALCLVGALISTRQFPIHLRARTKVYMGSIPLYLMAVLLPPLFAAVAAGAGILAAEMMVRARKGSTPSDIATISGSWVPIVALGALVAHISVGGRPLETAALFGTALILWAGNTVTSPLLLSPITGEAPRRIVVAVARESYLAEGAQYLVGLLGALVAREELWALSLLALPSALVYLAFKSSKELRESTRQLLENMADAVDLRDAYTGGHSRRVAELSDRILRELHVAGPERDLILAAARVHDIGKIGVPDHVLKKEGALTEEEWALMKAHADQGAELLMRYSDFARGVEIVRHHHERWDGQGYPHRKQGTEIPFGARVIAVADSYDAMTSDRPYRIGMPVDRAVAILREGRGIQWDGVIVDAFVRSIADRLEHPARPMLHLVSDTSDTDAVRTTA